MRSTSLSTLERGIPAERDIADYNNGQEWDELSVAALWRGSGPPELTNGPSQTRRIVISTEDIVVPAHLLGTVSDRSEWTPRPADESAQQGPHARSDTREDFDVVRIAHEQRNQFERRIERANSHRTAQLERDARASIFAVPGAGLPRWPRTSLPSNILDRTTSIQETTITAPANGIPKSSVGALGVLPSNAPTGVIDFANQNPFAEQLTDSTTLFTRLSNYDMRTQGRPHLPTKISDGIDPFSDSFVSNDGAKASEFSEKDNIGTGDFIPTDAAMDHGRRPSIVQVAAETVINAVQAATEGVANMVRRSSLHDVYEKAKVRSKHLQRKKWVQVMFEYAMYVFLLAFTYFVLVGVPLWKGAVWWLYWVVDHKFVVPGTWSVTIGFALIYAFAPLCMLFEKEPPMPADIENIDPTQTPGVHNVALLIPCYKSENIVGPTLESALKVFPASHIFVIANGNSPTPLDNTEKVCNKYGVNHVWSPVGSKIVAQFVGCYAAKHFENVLLIDDDCALPPNFPIVSERMKGKVGCIGYTIKSVGPNSSKGTYCCQAQDIEYKLSGLQRQFAGAIGSATFPHGAISLWNTNFLIDTFHTHPGFSVSEDWFFGHVARKLGCRIKMCSAVFVETETPSAVFFAGGGSRGGFGEMTIFKQRFYRWNFFFVNGMYYNMAYILGSWKLGWWGLGAKLFVWQEVYETLLYLLAPFMLPISLIVRPAFCGYLTAATFALYFVNVTVSYLKALLLGMGSHLCRYLMKSIFDCGMRGLALWLSIHPKIVEDEKAVEIVLRLEEHAASTLAQPAQGRRMTIEAVGTRLAATEVRPSIESQHNPEHQPVDSRVEEHMPSIEEAIEFPADNLTDCALV
ncbi:hypothetical protein LTR08_002942 [Meristemomyces frigidus]|nr:hypothetical protein LTR08_002942 [Meristemomyces frigidus]